MSCSSPIFFSTTLYLGYEKIIINPIIYAVSVIIVGLVVGFASIGFGVDQR